MAHVTAAVPPSPYYSSPGGAPKLGPATYCGNLVPARTQMTADPANHQFSDKSRLENSSSEIARHFPVLMLRPGRHSRAQNSAYHLLI